MAPPRLWKLLPALLTLAFLLPPGPAAQENGIVQKLYDNALQLLRSGKTEEALKGFEQIYTSYGKSPQAPDALFQAGTYHYPVVDLNDLGIATREQIQRAIPLFEWIRKQHETSTRAPEALYRLGLLALEPDNPRASANEAYAAFTSVANVYPDSPLVGDALYGAAMSQLRSGAFDDAQAAFARLLEQVPGYASAGRARLALGYCQYRAGDYQRAMEEYQKVRDRYPGKPEAQVALERLTLLHRLRLLPSTGRAVVYGLDASYLGKLEALGLRSVTDMALGPDGDLVVADGKQGLTQKVDPRGHPAGRFSFPGIAAVALDRRGNPVYVGGGNIQVGKQPQPLTRPDSAGPRPVRETTGVAVDRDGKVYVVDSRTNEVLSYGRALDFRAPIHRSAGGKVADLKAGIDNQIYILDSKDKNVTVLSEGKAAVQIRLAEPPASIADPAALAVDELGDLYISDAGTGRVVVLDPSGKRVLALLGADRVRGGVSAPDRIEVDRQGRIYVYDRKADAILRFQ
jgi:TolA-binding protein/streptogramin lyase